jgi:hypothetical protein
MHGGSLLTLYLYSRFLYTVYKNFAYYQLFLASELNKMLELVISSLQHELVLLAKLYRKLILLNQPFITMHTCLILLFL